MWMKLVVVVVQEQEVGVWKGDMKGEVKLNNWKLPIHVSLNECKKERKKALTLFWKVNKQTKSLSLPQN